jgi:hypothetical protein
MKAEIDAACGILAMFAAVVGAFGVVAAVTWCAWTAVHRKDGER